MKEEIKNCREKAVRDGFRERNFSDDLTHEKADALKALRMIVVAPNCTINLKIIVCECLSQPH